MAQRKFYISAARLRANNACESQIERFNKVFDGGKILLNDHNFKIAVEEGFSIWWLAIKYLPRRVYDSVREATRYSSYESESKAFWRAIKAQMKADKAERPAEWYE